MFDLHITNFANPGLLWLGLVIPLLGGYYIWRHMRGEASIRISSVDGIDTRRTFRHYMRHMPFVFRCIAIALIIVALARPQNREFGSKTTTEGVDIMLAIDVSGSMLARDFTPNRITAAKETAAKFIVDRRDDRIGLVVFAGESFTQSPLTTDKRALQMLLSKVRNNMIEDGTAIGNGLATAVNRIKDSNAASKVIILLTDGVNNAGQISPQMAADIAASYGIRVYTIGVGTRGMAPTPAYDIWGNEVIVQVQVEIDEDVLREISAKTGGEYFRATDNNSLTDVYEKINELEKSKIETNEYTKYNELYAGFALLALLSLVLEFVIRRLVLRSIP